MKDFIPGERIVVALSLMVVTAAVLFIEAFVKLDPDAHKVIDRAADILVTSAVVGGVVSFWFGSAKGQDAKPSGGPQP